MFRVVKATIIRPYIKQNKKTVYTTEIYGLVSHILK